MRYCVVMSKVAFFCTGHTIQEKCTQPISTCYIVVLLYVVIECFSFRELESLKNENKYNV